jgi:hypothetical protein
MVGPFKTEDTGVHTIHTRTTIFIPFELVSAPLHNEYTAKEVFQRLLSFLETESLEIMCGPFLDFLQIASTHPNDAMDHPFTWQDHLGLKRHPVRPAVVKLRLSSILYILLPDLQSTGAALHDALALIISTGLANIITEMHVDRGACDNHATKARSSNTLCDKYGEWTADSILLLTRASDDDFLSAYYQGRGGKG